MNPSKIFIDRPIFAGVLSVVILLAGLIAIFLLPISEYPDVVPPSVLVKVQYPGANPKVIAETVASPLEEQINGVEGMLYMQSQANSSGNLTITVTFKLGTDPDKATQLVQNRVNQALPHLPEDVQRLGVTTIKSSPAITMIVHLISPDNRYDMTYLRNYALINVKDRLSRIQGVGEVQLWGAGDYAMRVWLDPQKVAQRNLTANDVVKAIRDQNVQVAAGVIGASPTLPGTPLQLSVNARGRLQNAEEFGDIVVKTAPDGAVTHLRDIARIQLGASDYGLRALLDNDAAVAMPVYQLPGANSLQIADEVRKTMAELKQDFPAGVDYRIVYDQTLYMRSSINAVIHTLVEAIVLVSIVVVVFLQTWRASIIPLIAVPVSIVGTFSLLLLFGYSINTLSLFGMVLAIGIVVDDAIVVVENVERNIENGLSAREAAYKTMQEVSGPIIAIALTLVAVFVPLAFMSGLTGQFYKQFAMTIAISTVISAFNSLTLSPALSALLLKSHGDKEDWFTRAMNRVLGGFFRGFNKVFHRGAQNYGRGVRGVLSRKTAILGVYFVLIGVAILLARVVPSGFIPAMDRGYLVAFARLPNGASLDRTEDVMRQMASIALKQPGVDHAPAFPGMSVNGFMNSSSSGIVFVMLKQYSQRHGMSADAVAAALTRQYSKIKGASIAVFPPPPVFGLGTLGGFKMQIEDRGSVGYAKLADAANDFIKRAKQAPELRRVFTNYQINVPQLNVDLDRVKAKQLGVNVTDVFDT
ncbi:efflux RND transporter permease subunit, partial [Burkholderia singularis]